MTPDHKALEAAARAAEEAKALYDNPPVGWVKGAWKRHVEADEAFIALANPSAILSLLSDLATLAAENEALRAVTDEAQGLLIECQSALIGRDDVCMDEDGNDAIGVWREKARALTQGDRNAG